MLSKGNRHQITTELSSQKRSDLGKEFAKLHRQLQNTNKSMLIVVEGWESSGKGYLLKDLSRELDPRYYEVNIFKDASETEIKYPHLRRFFLKSPKHGQIMFFDRSFYYHLLTDADITQDQRVNILADIKFYEEILHNDETAIVKLFLHQTEDEMNENIQKLEADQYRHVHIGHLDYLQIRHYNKFFKHFDEVLKETNFVHTPWHLLFIDGKKNTSRYALQLCIDVLKAHLNTHDIESEYSMPPLPTNTELPLTQIDLSTTIDEDKYDNILKNLQKYAGDLLYQTYIKQKSVIVVYEGIDAAGKGGNIRRLTRFMDPRGYDVATVASPTPLENNHHYLWRFYRDFPAMGQMTIFDRSWYGRVLVERVENLIAVHRWQEAYHEINQMEKNIVNQSILLLKYFIVIDKDEQESRLKDREHDPEKQYKLTEADWISHEQFDSYSDAINEMLVRTSTPHAPWLIVSGTDKKCARITVLKDFISHMEKYLDDK